MRTCSGFWLIQKMKSGDYHFERFDIATAIRHDGGETTIFYGQSDCWCSVPVYGLYLEIDPSYFGYRPRPIINEAGIFHTTHFINMRFGQIYSVGSRDALDDLIINLTVIRSQRKPT